MTLTQLNYILAVERCRNFAQAAKECFVTQPTLSMQIQKLEDYLQVIIFDRSKNPVEPTPMGKTVLSYAQKVMNASNELEELAKSLRGEISGEFVLGIIPTLAPYVLPLFVNEFIQKYPKVELKVYEYQTEEIIRLLRDGKIDGAILATPLEEKDIVEEPLFYEPFEVFFSPTHELLKKKSVEQKDLDLKEAWLLKEGHCMRTQALSLCKVSKEKEDKNLFFEAGSMETLINMVKTSQGFTILPKLAIDSLSDKDRKLLREFKGKVPVREVSFVTGPFSMKKSIEKAMIEVLLSCLPKELKKAGAKSEILSIH